MAESQEVAQGAGLLLAHFVTSAAHLSTGKKSSHGRFKVKRQYSTHSEAVAVLWMETQNLLCKLQFESLKEIN